MGEELIDYICNVKGSIHLGSFWGGGKGRCVQLTIGMNYVQMTYDEAIRFFNDCIQKINEMNEKYNENVPWWEKLAKQDERY